MKLLTLITGPLGIRGKIKPTTLRITFLIIKEFIIVVFKFRSKFVLGSVILELGNINTIIIRKFDRKEFIIEFLINSATKVN